MLRNCVEYLFLGVQLSQNIKACVMHLNMGEAGEEAWWSKGTLHVVDTFYDVIFTDETTIQLHKDCTISFCKIGEQQPYKMRPKHTAKLHVWAGISRRGASDFLVFKEVWMHIEFYCHEILLGTDSHSLRGGQQILLGIVTSRITTPNTPRREFRWWPRNDEGPI